LTLNVQSHFARLALAAWSLPHGRWRLDRSAEVYGFALGLGRLTRLERVLEELSRVHGGGKGVGRGRGGVDGRTVRAVKRRAARTAERGADRSVVVVGITRVRVFCGKWCREHFCADSRCECVSSLSQWTDSQHGQVPQAGTEPERHREKSPKIRTANIVST